MMFNPPKRGSFYVLLYDCNPGFGHSLTSLATLLNLIYIHIVYLNSFQYLRSQQPLILVAEYEGKKEGLCVWVGIVVRSCKHCVSVPNSGWFHLLHSCHP